MTEREIKEHMLNKEKDKNYPRLPKFILDKRKINPGLAKSILRGFYKRLENYHKMQEYKQKSYNHEDSIFD